MRTETKEIKQTITQYISDDGKYVSTNKEEVEKYEIRQSGKEIRPLFKVERTNMDETIYVYAVTSEEDFLSIKHKILPYPKYYIDFGRNDLIEIDGVQYYVFSLIDNGTDYPYYNISTIGRYIEDLKQDMEYDKREYLRKQAADVTLLKNLEYINERHSALVQNS